MFYVSLVFEFIIQKKQENKKMKKKHQTQGGKVIHNINNIIYLPFLL